MTDASRHWDDAYAARVETSLPWFEPVPRRSLDLVREAATSRSAAILDVGGGASRLVDGLLADGYTDLSVLDASAVALDRSRSRLGVGADAVSWIVADITRWRPERVWSVWHDRAVLHFLVDQRDRDAYLAALRRATAPGSSVIIATFAPDGPDRCSSLPVRRYRATDLADLLGVEFRLHAEVSALHETPAGTAQAFVYAAFRRR